MNNLAKHLLEPDKTDIKRAQMLRTVVQLAQFLVTIAILGVNLYLLIKFGR